VTFTVDGTPQAPVALAGGAASFTVASLAAGDHTIATAYSGDLSFQPSAATITQTVGKAGTETALSTSPNPSDSTQEVTLTAAVTPVAPATATPTGTVTFEIDGSAVGTADLDNGTASLVVGPLPIGNHAIRAVYKGSTIFHGSASDTVEQVVVTPDDSRRLAEMQRQTTPVVALTTQNAMDGAIEEAFDIAFNPGGPDASLGPDGMSFSYAPVADANDPFAALDPVRRWSVWGHFAQSGWMNDPGLAGLRGTQLNGFAGLSYRLAPDVVVGLLGGYETFAYTDTLINAQLDGQGWTVGGYAAARLGTNLRIDARLAYSGLTYAAAAGAANGAFNGSRILASTGIAGLHQLAWLTIEPSLRLSAAWEQQNAYVDSLGTPQAAFAFAIYEVAAGARLSHTFQGSFLAWTPSLGAYVDGQFGAVTPQSGWSGRVTAGLKLATPGGAALSVSGDVLALGGRPGIGWAVRGGLRVPF
jgi:hypothetical protein